MTRRFIVCGIVLAVLVPSAGAATAAENPSVSCAALTGQTISADTIGLPTTGATITSTALQAATDALPEYCAISGVIAPVDASAPNIGFGVAIPTAWNGKSWQLGGGGNDGSVPNLTSGPPNLTGGNPAPLLTQGYATYGSDSGHQGNGVDWILNHESMMNFAYEQLKKTHDVAMEVMRRMYGHAATVNSFMGNSQGGREGLEAVTRYPDDYDGVTVGVPLAYFASLILDVPYVATKQLGPGGWIPPTKGPAVAHYLLGRCDNVNGVINDYLACNAKADPTSTPDPFAGLLCPGGADTGATCLSAAQLPVLKDIYGPLQYDYPGATGERWYPGWGTGMEGQPGWLWPMVQPVAGSTTWGQGPGAVSTRAFLCNCVGGDFSVLSLDVNAPVFQQRIQTLSDQVDVREDISGWLRRGGKLIWVTHASDAISNPVAQMMLYDRLVARYGRTVVDQHIKYYVVPNQGHGDDGVDADGNPLPYRVDAQSALQRWVEDGVTPPSSLDAVTMSPADPRTIIASKPSCLFPAYPKYVMGPLTSAGSYVCGDALTDLQGQITATHTPRRVQAQLSGGVRAIRANLADTGRACRAVGALSGAVLDDALHRGAGLDTDVADRLITTVTAVKWGIGCISPNPTDAAEHQVLNAGRTLAGLRLPGVVDGRLRASIGKVGDALVASTPTPDGACRSVAGLADQITRLTRRPRRLTEEQATALQAATQAIGTTLRCAG